MSIHQVGEVRPSQLLWTYGPGALIDLPNLSVVTMGLDRWQTDRCLPVEEVRLLAAVRRILGQQVTHLRIPPFLAEERVDPLSAEGKVGVPVRPFPRWFRCVRCGLLAELDTGLFKIIQNLYRPELTHFIHTNCEKGARSDAVPARFLLACRNGHLDDFPWHWFVHGGPCECRGTLRFFERGASLQTENLWVKCDVCDTSRSLVHAFGRRAQENLPACRGRHPHLDTYDSNCNEQSRAVLLGATNSWFPVSLSVLAIPVERNQLAQLILNRWDLFSDVESIEQVGIIIKTLAKIGALPGIEKYKPEEVWRAIQERKDGTVSETNVSEGDIKGPEWNVLISPNPPTDWPHFLSLNVDAPKAYKGVLASVLLLERLREVNALVGYTRVEAPEDSADEGERPPMAQLCRGTPEWVPANEVHGEGIFIRFHESAVKKWEKWPSVLGRDRKMVAGHHGWRSARRLAPADGYPGIRYAMLHTFAHLLIRELALECGYNAASIRERIYASDDTVSPMAGILLYTAAADSDGTLGGLVELGRPENLGRLISRALTRASVCSSDPLCSEHDPSEDRSLHASACHSCLFVSETSCERGNRYLDRALLVETFECKDAMFFTKESIGEDDGEPFHSSDDIQREANSEDLSNENEQSISTCQLRDLSSIAKPDKRIYVLLPDDQCLDICDEYGKALFRFPGVNEKIEITKGTTLILCHPELQMGGNYVEIVAGKVMAVQHLINPETDTKMIQITLRSGKHFCVLSLEEAAFLELQPLCILD